MTAYKAAANRGEITGDGIVSAVIATFDVIDHDADVVTSKAIRDGSVCAISTWNHGSWNPGQPPIGVGVLRTTRTEAIVDARFFMKVQAGAETFEAIRNLMELGIGEWSWSLDDIVSRPGQLGNRTVRFIDGVKVRECSPVMRGASINTRTLDAKDAITDQQRHELDRIRRTVERDYEADTTVQLGRALRNLSDRRP